MPTPAQIRKIHALKNVLKLTDEEYRSLLGEFGVSTSKELDVWGANAITALVGETVKRDFGAERVGIKPAPGMTTVAQCAMIRDLILKSNGSILYPCSWMSRVVGRYIDPAIGWGVQLTKEDASKVIDALKRHLKSIEKKEK